MTAILIDTSIVIKWFHSDGESELAAARSLRDGHIRGHLDAYILDLAVYEVGNVLAAGVAESATAAARRLGLVFDD